MSHVIRAVLVLFAIAPTAIAQDHTREHEAEHEHAAAAAPASGWTFTTDANVIAGFNYQQRRYFDFAAWESQNWLMGTAERAAGQGRLRVEGMLSLEPLTVGRYVYRVDSSRFAAGGSPQLFQTGETFDDLPLVDYQHPHDLIMGLGAVYERPAGRLTLVAGADLVGSPTLGPTPFMHRESARDNPQVPLAHHMLDSTHSTAGVLRAGVRLAEWQFEASAFRGAEPDERRYDIDQPRLDSWAGRVTWRHAGWDAQVSGGHLHQPEWYAPWDQTRLTASIGYTGAFLSRPLSLTAAAGQTREAAVPSVVVSNGGLVEWHWRALGSLSTYGRAEVVRKELLGIHVHRPGEVHPHFLSDVGAFTFGLVQDLAFFGLDRRSGIGIGADGTLYAMGGELEPIFGGSRSFHVFVRWRPAAPGAAHVH